MNTSGASFAIYLRFGNAEQLNENSKVLKPKDADTKPKLQVDDKHKITNVN